MQHCIHLPERFLVGSSSQCIFEWKANHAKTAALGLAISDLRESQDMEAVKAEIVVKLPFKVKEQFFAEAEIGVYRHDNSHYRNNSQKYYILHLEFLAAVKPREVKPTVTA